MFWISLHLTSTCSPSFSAEVMRLNGTDGESETLGFNGGVKKLKKNRRQQMQQEQAFTGLAGVYSYTHTHKSDSLVFTCNFNWTPSDSNKQSDSPLFRLLGGNLLLPHSGLHL